MKKLFIVLSFVAFAALTFSSCKKDYVCECTYTSALGTPERNEVPYNNTTKSQAEEACANYKLPGTTNTNCKLK